MAPITVPYNPKTEIFVCEGVGFDLTNDIFRLFPDASTQLAYFRGKALYTTNTANPVRLRGNRGSIDVENPADYYDKADYVVFRNSNFDSARWFFCYIESIDYVSINGCIINFRIDPMQTYFTDLTFPPCYIERQHWATDNIGDNLVSDNLELGDYVINHNTRTGYFNTYSIIALSSVDKNGNPIKGGFYGGIYSGLGLLEFTSITELNDWLAEIVNSNKSGAVQTIFMMPREFIKASSTDINSEPVTQAYIYSAPERNTVDGYTPRNNKLLTYPYKLLQVSNLSGASADYAYEYFATGKPTFNITGDYSPNPTVKLSPVGYNGIDDSTNAYDYGLTLNGFPQCAWTTDAYLAWLAQTGSVSALGMTFTGQDISYAQQGLGAVSQLISGNVLGAASSFLSISQSVAKVNATKSLPPQAHGQTANGAMVAFKAKDFFFSDMSVRSQFARIIDGYWDKYGYPCKELRTMNFTSRPYWNFIKTQGCYCTGSVPSWARAEVQEIFDNGVTIWHTDNIGNYYLNNKP